MLKRIYRHLDDHVETYLSATLLVTFSTLAILQVVMRYVFSSSLTWSEEISRYAFVWFVYMSASYAVRYQRHVKFNVLVDQIGKFSALAERLLRLLALLLWVAFLAVVFILSVELVDNQLSLGQVSPANRIPMGYVYLGLPIGLALMTFRVTQHIIWSIADLIKNPHVPMKPREEGVD